MNQRTYRRNVLGIFINPEWKVLAVERSDVPGAWQLPQGGIERGESEEQAFFREMSEELGVPQDAIEILDSMPEYVIYDFPDWVRQRSDWLNEYKGQKQRVFLARLANGVEPSIERSDGENRAFKWVELDSLIDSVVEFKRDAYKKIASWFYRHKHLNRG